MHVDFGDGIRVMNAKINNNICILNYHDMI